MNTLEDTTLLEELLSETATCAYDEEHANWVAGCRTCGRSVLWCDNHYQAKMREIAAGRRLWMCRDCTASSREWHRAFFVRPA